MSETEVTGHLPHLMAALLEAQSSLGSVSKDKENKASKYDYVSAEAMIRDCRKALHDAGLVLFLRNQHVELLPSQLPTREGMKDGLVVKVTRHFLLAYPLSGEAEMLSYDWSCPVENHRPVDKACAVAATSAMNYFLRDLLLVPRVDPSDDLDADGPADRQEQARSAARGKKMKKDDVEMLAQQCQAGARTLNDLKGKGLDAFIQAVESWENGTPF